MTIRDALKNASHALSGGYGEAAAILSVILRKDKSYVFANPDTDFGDVHLKAFDDAVAQRVLGKPLQYITGFCEFMSLTFKVNSDVLIPRPETEILVEKVLDICAGHDMKDKYDEHNYVSILDLGTGSGCIAVSLAHHFDRCMVTASDISVRALEVAAGNAAANGISSSRSSSGTGRLTFVRSDLFESLVGRTFDIIVSNPPYVVTSDIMHLQREVRDFEPYIALDGGTDGMRVITRIIEGSVSHLNPGGWLVLEVGYDQAARTGVLMHENGCYTNIGVVRDIEGIDRVVIARIH